MIKPVSRDEIPLPGAYSSKLKREIEEFIATGEPVGEVELNGRSPGSVSSSIRTYILRYNYPLRQVQRAQRVFVVRTDMGGSR